VSISFTVTWYLNVQFILELGNNGLNTFLKIRNHSHRIRTGKNMHLSM
jgi:hypothetical protein